MPSITARDETRIEYEVHGAGPPLLMIHGRGGSRANWHERGFVEPLKGQYRMILVDVRGHGASDGPHDPRAYSLTTIVEDVKAVMDAEGVTAARVWGLSMGAIIAAAVMSLTPERCVAVAMGGAPAILAPLRETSMSDEVVDSRVSALEKGIDSFIELILQDASGAALPPERLAALRQADARALAALYRGQQRWFDEIDELPWRDADVPALIYCGEHDQFCHVPGRNLARETADEMRDARFVSLGDRGHVDGLASLLGLDMVTTFFAQNDAR